MSDLAGPPRRPGGPTVAVVVLNWNGRDDTLRCLASMAEADQPHQVVLVDNGSVDGSVAAVAERFPAVEVVALGANTGYCAGNNAGLRWALDHDFDLVGVLNNDTVVDPGFLGPLVDRLAEEPRSVVSPRIVYLDQPDRAWFGASLIDARVGIGYHRDESQLGEREAAAAVRPVPALTGCCLLATRAAWREVGLFDERFFLIFEDADWSARARAAGYRLDVVVASTVRHAVGASFAGASSAVGDYYYARNGLLYLRLHGAHPARQSVRLGLRLGRESLRRLWHHPGRAAASRLVAQGAGAVDFARGRFGPRGGPLPAATASVVAS